MARPLESLMMIIGGVGFTGGAAIGGFIAAWLIPAFGWRSVLYFGGGAPLFTRAPKTGKRVACVGAGPASLAAAWKSMEKAGVKLNLKTEDTVDFDARAAHADDELVGDVADRAALA